MNHYREETNMGLGNEKKKFKKKGYWQKEAVKRATIVIA